MNKYRAVIIEDEYPAREIIKEYLTDNDKIEIIAEFSDGLEGLKGINQLNPDLIFLDIQMPKLTAFEMIDLLDIRPEIIFTTAFDQYAIKAFEENAIDYLLKPFSMERFFDAVDKAVAKMEGKKEGVNKVKLENPMAEINPLKRIVVKNKSDIIVISVEQVVYIEAEDDYVMIHLKDKKYLKQKTMNYFENNLDPIHFLRVHRSFIVRLDQIDKIEPYGKSANIAILKNGKTIPISRAGYVRMKKTLDI